jgi:hypothetical protein
VTTITNLFLDKFFKVKIKASPVLESKAPVGSSAKMM